MIYAFSLCSVGRAGINASTGRTMEDKANDLVTWSDKAKKVEDKKANDLVSFLQQCSPLFLCQTSSHLLSVLKTKLCLELDPVGSTVRLM